MFTTAESAAILDLKLAAANGPKARLALLTKAVEWAEETALDCDWQAADGLRAIIPLIDRTQRGYETDASDKVAKEYDFIRKAAFTLFLATTTRVAASLRHPA